MFRMLRPLMFLLLLALTIAAVQPMATLADPVHAPSSSPMAAQAQPGRIVSQAFDLLMDRFVIPPDSSDVLNGGWKAGLTALREKGVQDLPSEDLGLTNDREADWRRFAERYGELARAAEGKLEQGELDRAIVAGMAAAMDEGHTYYMTPEAFRNAQEMIRNSVRYAGVGARFNRELIVIEVFEGSPAEAGGLRRGDQLIAVEGQSVEGQTPAEASARARGDPCTPVELTVRRAHTREPVKFNMTRTELRVDWLSYRVLDGGIGYLQIRNFPTPDALGSFRAAMDRFDEADIRALVIDVRGNGGGSVDTGIHVASRFIPQRQPLFQRIDRQGGQRTITAWGDYWGRDVPIAVLVDGASGSMSEILAAALQENGIAPVFGVKTSGAVAGTNYHPLADGSALAVTSLLINSGQGKVLNKVGLEPDQVVELDVAGLRAGRDNQLEAALGYVRQEVANRAARDVSVVAMPLAS